MPELPEIYNIAKQLNKQLKGKSITQFEVKQEKCLNKSYKDLSRRVKNKKINLVTYKGKWIKIELYNDTYILINLGMGADFFYYNPGKETSKKYVIKLTFNDNSLVTIRFGWFGHFHVVDKCELSAHKAFSSLGIDPYNEIDFTFDRFMDFLGIKKSSIKSFLLNQKNIAGIGNVYIQDILFLAQLHPNRKITEITLNEKKELFNVIKQNLAKAIEAGGLAYEKDIYNKPGQIKSFLVGYKENSPCPKCKAIIQKIKTGSTSSYICPKCQK